MCSDERHPRPGTKRPREEEEDEEEDLNESNYDEVRLLIMLHASVGACSVCVIFQERGGGSIALETEVSLDGTE